MSDMIINPLQYWRLLSKEEQYEAWLSNLQKTEKLKEDKRLVFKAMNDSLKFQSDEIEKLKEQVALLDECVKFYALWKNYATSKHPSYEQYNAEIKNDSGEISYTENDGDVFIGVFGGKRAREVLKRLEEMKDE